MPKKPHTASNVLMFINAEHKYALFSDDIIVPARQVMEKGFDVYVVGPCPHLHDNEFTIPVEAYDHPTIH